MQIKLKTQLISGSASVSLGIIGSLATGFIGAGILAGLGFQAVDKIAGLKLESLSEKIAKFISPNYLVTIFDFKKGYNIKDW